MFQPRCDQRDKAGREQVPAGRHGPVAIGIQQPSRKTSSGALAPEAPVPGERIPPRADLGAHAPEPRMNGELEPVRVSANGFRTDTAT
jgi:hypothetical protein